MKNQKRIIFIAVLVLIAATASAVTWLKTNRRLGTPGIKAVARPGTLVMDIGFPDRALEFAATTPTNLPQEQVVLNYLPADTSYAKRRYVAPDGFAVNASIILMGTDRSSIHKADYCLEGSGFRVVEKATEKILIAGPQPYEFSVAKWSLSREVKGGNGEVSQEHGLYVFWFVADGKSTPSHSQYRNWLMWDMLRTFTWHRWAYVGYIASCAPGQEDATFERMKELIATSVPEFQLPPASAVASRP